MQRRVCMLRHGSGMHLPSVLLRPQRAQGLVVRIAGTEVLEDDERIAGARVLDHHTRPRRVSGDEQLVLVISPNRIIAGVETR